MRFEYIENRESVSPEQTRCSAPYGEGYREHARRAERLEECACTSSVFLDALMHFYLYGYFLDAFMDAIWSRRGCLLCAVDRMPIMSSYSTGLNTIYDSMQQTSRVVRVYVDVPIPILVRNSTWFTQLASPVWPVWPQHIHEGIEIRKGGGGSSCEEK